MRGNELLDKMELIDPAYVEAADIAPPKRKNLWVRWGMAAACICLIAGGIAAYQAKMDQAPPRPQESIAAQDYGFCLNGDSTFVYFPITFAQRRQYGLVPENAVGLTKENTYTIREEDLGDLMGVVTDCEDESLNGCNVYHFAEYPEKDSICIVDAPGGYAFYVCGWIYVENEIGASSDMILSAYGLPESLEKMELLTPARRHIMDIEDVDVIRSVLELLSGKTNSGLEANERRFAKAWYDAYGNDDVYYSEEDGYCRFREKLSQEEPVTEEDGQENTSPSANRMQVYNKAQELWTKGERIIQLKTYSGYQLMIDYFPSIRTFICAGGYYELPADETQAMNSLLQITD